MGKFNKTKNQKKKERKEIVRKVTKKLKKALKKNLLQDNLPDQLVFCSILSAAICIASFGYAQAEISALSLFLSVFTFYLSYKERKEGRRRKANRVATILSNDLDLKNVREVALISHSGDIVGFMPANVISGGSININKNSNQPRSGKIKV